MKNICCGLLAILLFNINLQALPLESRVPGGIALLNLGAVESDTSGKIINYPTVTFEGKKALIANTEGNFIAIIGIPLSLKANVSYIAKVQQNNINSDIPIVVSAKAYPEQHLSIKNQRMVTPNPEDLQRINSEQEILAKARYYWNNSDVYLDFSRPLPNSKIISKFGLKRFFNGEPRQPHNGIDLPAPKGTAVTPLASGKIILTGDFYFNGKTVFVSHGQGLVSFYCHLDEILGREGDEVNPQTLIAKVGSTGRSTGPHLHLSVFINGNEIDPELFVDNQENKSPIKKTTK